MGALVEIKAEQLQELDRLAKETDRPLSVIVEEALSAYLRNEKSRSLDAAFGLWRNLEVDGLQYQEEIRKEW